MTRLDGGGVVVRVAVAVWQHGDRGDDVLTRARIALRGTALTTLAR